MDSDCLAVRIGLVTNALSSFLSALLFLKIPLILKMLLESSRTTITPLPSGIFLVVRFSIDAILFLHSLNF
ncbi:MAG: hypothetical protein B6U76_08685 [Desulfurococcales archaeon ex4484_217_2]|nr:MAG: hypothetical protein B6U76_08685 [Desulfurococcales archaeon ex4484_217_2]